MMYIIDIESVIRVGFDIEQLPPATSHQPPATSHQPPATSHQPPAVIILLLPRQQQDFYKLANKALQSIRSIHINDTKRGYCPFSKEIHAYK